MTVKVCVSQEIALPYYWGIIGTDLHHIIINYKKNYKTTVQNGNGVSPLWLSNIMH